ncbi:MAG: hypothetical protein ABMA25_06440 [Ilumatobacteraceae bacterium]
MSTPAVGRRNPAEPRAYVARLAPYTRFRLVLLLTGIAPLIIVPMVLRAWPLPATGWWNTSFIYVTGVLHVGMTSFFYVDPEMRQFRRERPHLFITWPVAIGVVTAFALAVLPDAGRAAVTVTFAAWLGWHYTGQQVGVVAMALKGEVATARLRPRERTFVKATAVVTIAGLVRTVDLSDTPLRHLDLLLVCRVAVIVLGVWLVWLLRSSARTPADGGGSWATRAVALSWTVAFVLPFAVVQNPIASAAAVATVHGFHYVFLVAYLSRSRRQRAWMGTLTMGALTAALYVALLEWAPVNGVFSHAVPCITFTMVAAHRVVDMRVWRLREPERLDYMRRSFHFL